MHLSNAQANKIHQKNPKTPPWTPCKAMVALHLPINGPKKYNPQQKKKRRGSIITSQKTKMIQRKRPTGLDFLPFFEPMFSERRDEKMEEERAYCDDDDDDSEVFGGGFMKLLGCEDVVFEKRVQVEEGCLFSPPYYSTSTSSSSSSSAGCYPQMLHFGGGREEFLLFNTDNYSLVEAAAAAAAPSPSGRSRTRASKKVAAASATPVTVASNKKSKAGSAGIIKVRNEKLGERISALQQLVSPFGKTDTATVLHEAIGYIRFLHDQVQVLSSPYLQLPFSSHQPEEEGDLRSRGLCLVPVSCTEDVASSSSVNIGADLWSPAAVGGGSSSSSSGSKH